MSGFWDQDEMYEPLYKKCYLCCAPDDETSFILWNCHYLYPKSESKIHFRCYELWNLLTGSDKPPCFRVRPKRDFLKFREKNFPGRQVNVFQMIHYDSKIREELLQNRNLDNAEHVDWMLNLDPVDNIAMNLWINWREGMTFVKRTDCYNRVYSPKEGECFICCESDDETSESQWKECCPNHKLHRRCLDVWNFLYPENSCIYCKDVTNSLIWQREKIYGEFKYNVFRLIKEESGFKENKALLEHWKRLLKGENAGPPNLETIDWIFSLEVGYDKTEGECFLCCKPDNDKSCIQWFCDNRIQQANHKLHEKCFMMWKLVNNGHVFSGNIESKRLALLRRTLYPGQHINIFKMLRHDPETRTIMKKIKDLNKDEEYCPHNVKYVDWVLSELSELNAYDSIIK